LLNKEGKMATIKKTSRWSDWYNAYTTHRGAIKTTIIMALAAAVIAMALHAVGPKRRSKEINYYMQSVRVDGAYYEVFTGVFHHRLGRVWHRKLSIYRGVMALLLEQEVEAKQVLKNVNLYDQKKRKEWQQQDE